MAKEALETQCLEELKKLGPLTEEQLAECDSSCLQRYLRARDNDVKKAAKLLFCTLTWKAEFKVGTLNKSEFEKDLLTARMYIAGNDAAGRSILVTRKRAEAFKVPEYSTYLRFLVFSLETAVKAMQNGQEKWVWILDMNGYSRANSPPLNITMATMKILADHYPERLHKCYFVDAPTVFYVMWRAVYPFIDAVTRQKIEFVSSKDYKAEINAYKLGAAGNGTTDADGKEQFTNFMKQYCEPYNELKYRELLTKVGW